MSRNAPVPSPLYRGEGAKQRVTTFKRYALNRDCSAAMADNFNPTG